MTNTLTIDPNIIDTTCQQLLEQSAPALRSQRLSRRQLRLAEPELLSADLAELHNLNQVVWTVIEDALPLCRALDVRLLMQQDPRMPDVPMLVHPIEDALAAAVDLCLEEGVTSLRVRTIARRDRAVATLERHCEGDDDLGWCGEWLSAGSMGQVELMIGDRTTRALGGRLLIQRRADDIRLLLELPTVERPVQACQVGMGELQTTRRPRKRIELPGMNEVPIIGTALPA